VIDAQEAPDALIPGGRFGLAFRLRQPQPSAPTSLLVLLHGVGSSELSVSGLGAGIDPGTLVVLARGPLALGPEQFAWFRVAFTQDGPKIVEAEAEQARQILIGFIAKLQAHYRISAEKTVVAGFSQGGIMSASVALSQPEVLAGFGVLSGRILPELAPHIAIPARLQSLKSFVGHGDFDSKLPVVWAQRSDQWLGQLNVTGESHRYPIDHGVSAAMQADFCHWAQRILRAD